MMSKPTVNLQIDILGILIILKEIVQSSVALTQSAKIKSEVKRDTK